MSRLHEQFKINRIDMINKYSRNTKCFHEYLCCYLKNENSMKWQ